MSNQAVCKMTAYELAKSIPPQDREQYIRAGILYPNINRYIYIYELFQYELARCGVKKEAYLRVGEKCFTCEENVRKIIQRMSREVG